jgi:hypothetical protein
MSNSTENIQDLLKFSQRLQKCLDDLFDAAEDKDESPLVTPAERRAQHAQFVKTLAPIVGEFRQCMRAIADLRKAEAGERARLRTMTGRVMTHLTKPLLHELRQISALHGAGKHHEAARQLQDLIDKRLLDILQVVSSEAVQEVAREQNLHH